MLTREQILEKTTRRLDVVEVKEWGDSVTLKAFTLAERAEYDADFIRVFDNDEIDPKAARGFYLKIAAATIVDPSSGELMFSESELSEFSSSSANAVVDIAQAALRINGILKGAIEEAEKN